MCAGVFINHSTFTVTTNFGKHLSPFIIFLFDKIIKYKSTIFVMLIDQKTKITQLLRY